MQGALWFWDDTLLIETLENPTLGDLLCWTGSAWAVARRRGWHYHVVEEK